MIDVSPSPPAKETYLGDAVLVSFDGYQLCLRTDDGNNERIYLEPAVWHALVKYVDGLKREDDQDEEEIQF
jgi:hypothetical protein